MLIESSFKKAMLRSKTQFEIARGTRELASRGVDWRRATRKGWWESG